MLEFLEEAHQYKPGPFPPLLHPAPLFNLLAGKGIVQQWINSVHAAMQNAHF